MFGINGSSTIERPPPPISSIPRGIIIPPPPSLVNRAFVANTTLTTPTFSLWGTQLVSSSQPYPQPSFTLLFVLSTLSSIEFQPSVGLSSTPHVGTRITTFPTYPIISALLHVDRCGFPSIPSYYTSDFPIPSIGYPYAWNTNIGFVAPQTRKIFEFKEPSILGGNHVPSMLPFPSNTYYYGNPQPFGADIFPWGNPFPRSTPTFKNPYMHGS